MKTFEHTLTIKVTKQLHAVYGREVVSLKRLPEGVSELSKVESVEAFEATCEGVANGYASALTESGAIRKLLIKCADAAAPAIAAEERFAIDKSAEEYRAGLRRLNEAAMNAGGAFASAAPVLGSEYHAWAIARWVAVQDTRGVTPNDLLRADEELRRALRTLSVRGLEGRPW